MAFQLTCPACQHPGIGIRSETPSCQHCGQAFLLQTNCPECQQPLERLKACGAVDFFCNQCRKMVSKQQVSYQLLPQGESAD
ncbi:zinc ribbon domain-containing protein [Dongshaea marina]|uniref:zinc ribbon domain-containing protein n=1 Tax=Dongshaea marina TaxID=2047966 RepID=UPI000D3ED989|nr:zinc ribbon domain-containing protein [Dongshaea marina]